MSTGKQLRDYRKKSLLVHHDDAFSTAETLKTNRPKAILFVNLFVIFKIAYTIVVKIAINDQKVHPLDISLIRTMVLGFLSFIAAKISGSGFSVPRH